MTGKGSRPLSSLSFSRSAFLAEPRRLSASGQSVLPPPGSRRQLALPEPYEPFTRSAIVALVLSPAGGFGVPWSSSPALDKTDLPHYSSRRVPLARIHCLHGIESGDYAAGKAGLLPKASLELDDPLSWKSSSTGRRHDGW